MNKSFKKLAVAIGVSAALGMGVAGHARADALAEAFIGVTGFTLLNATTNTALSLSNFSSLDFTDTLTNTAELNGVTTSTQAVATTFVGLTDAPQACVGTCPAENTYTAAGIPLTQVFARSDSLLAGAPITGVGPIPLGTTALTLGQTSVIGTNTGSAGSQIQLTSSFSFTVAADIENVGISFDANTFIRTWTSLGSTFGTLAGASISWTMTLTDSDGAILLQWAPDGSITGGTQTGLNVIEEDCNLNRNAAAGPNQQQSAQTCSGDFEATTTFGFVAGEEYNFTIQQNVNSQAKSVPEPGSLALLGLGLAGLGFSVFRRRKVS